MFEHTKSIESPQAGLSAVEVVIMASIMSILMIMVTESMTTLSSVRSEQRAHFHIADTADKVARRIERDVSFTSRVFCDDPDDHAFLDRMATPFPINAPTYRLPLLTSTGYFAPDVAGGDIETGNVLFLARRGPKMKVKYGASDEYLVQSLQFVIYAPVQDGPRLGLLRWISELAVNYWDLVDIADPVARTDVQSQLYQNGVLYAWDPLASAPDALWELADGGLLVPLAAEAKVLGDEDPVNSRPFADRAMQIAENGATTIPVPAFAQPQGSFPGGFELKVDGSATGKLIMLRLVTRSLRPNTDLVANEIRRFFHSNG